jgi:hypothetical protein
MLEFKVDKTDRFGARAGNIRLNNYDDMIETPTRAMTNADFGHVKSLREIGLFKDGFDSIPNRVIEVSSPFWPKRLKTLDDSYTTEKQKEQLYQYVEDQSRLALYSPVFSRTSVVSDKNNEILMNIQQQAGFKAITICDRHVASSTEILSKRISSAKQYITTYDNGDRLATFVQLEMEGAPYSLFIEKLKTVAKANVSGLILKYGSLKTNIDKYAALHEIFNDKNLLLHLSGIRASFKVNHMKNSLYTMMLMPTFGFDSVALWATGFGDVKEHVIHFGSARRFDTKTYAYQKLEKIYPDFNKAIDCDCLVDRHLTVKTFSNKFTGTVTTNDANKMHDLLSSQTELELESAAIKNQDLIRFLHTKPLAKEAVSALNLLSSRLYISA